MSVRHMTTTVFDIKPGDIISVTGHKGGEETIDVARAREYDGVMTVTDQTGWDTDLHPGDTFRLIHRTRY